MRKAFYVAIGLFTSIDALAQPLDQQALEAAWSRIGAHRPVPPNRGDLEEYLRLAARHLQMLQQQLSTLTTQCRHAGPWAICQQINRLKARIRFEQVRKAEAKKTLHDHYHRKDATDAKKDEAQANHN
jgi:hypothetical protein